MSWPCVVEPQAGSPPTGMLRRCHGWRRAFIWLLLPTEATLPSPSATRDCTRSVCPLRMSSHIPRSQFQTPRVRSSEPLMTRPLGSTATQLTGSEWPRRTAIGLPGGRRGQSRSAMPCGALCASKDAEQFRWQGSTQGGSRTGQHVPRAERAVRRARDHPVVGDCHDACHLVEVAIKHVLDRSRSRQPGAQAAGRVTDMGSSARGSLQSMAVTGHSAWQEVWAGRTFRPRRRSPPSLRSRPPL